MTPTFKGKWPDRERELCLTELVKAQGALDRHYLIVPLKDTKVTFRHARQLAESTYTAAGCYLPDTQEIIVSTRYIDGACRILLHEYGHAYYFQCLTEKQQYAFECWAHKHTEHLFPADINRLAKRFNARNWHELADALYRHNHPMAYRLRWAVRKKHGLGMYVKATPNPLMPLTGFDYDQTPTFKWAVSHNCLPYYDLGYPQAWEIFADAFCVHLQGVTPMPHPLLKRLKSTLPKAPV